MKARQTVQSRRRARASVLANWTQLRHGDLVEIIRNAQVIDSGRVERVSSSGNVLWIRPGETPETRPIFRSDGVLVRDGGGNSKAP